MEEDGGPVVTMREFLEEQEAEEETIDLVLGADDGDECTYKDGYLRRQAVFSCLTCTPGNAGVCTACSLKCHDGHEVLELWTKRNFRCDCGNSKFGGEECKLWKTKEPENEKNTYNKNFRGLYCTCDTTDEESMVQCCICEDWFHEHHLGIVPPEKMPKPEDYAELICSGCVSRCSFVLRYPELLIAPPTDAVGDENTVHEPAEKDSTTTSNVVVSGDHVIAEAVKTEVKVVETAEKTEVETVAVKTEVKEVETAKQSVAVNGDVAGCSQGAASCKLKDREGNEPATRLDKAVFMAWEWRKEICQCNACVEDYKLRGLDFLLDEADTIQSYEALAKEKRKNKKEQAVTSVMDMIDNLDHVKKLEFIYGVNDFTSKLKNFLESFGESGKTMTSADVHEFFERLKKRRKLA